MYGLELFPHQPRGRVEPLQHTYGLGEEQVEPMTEFHMALLMHHYHLSILLEIHTRDDNGLAEAERGDTVIISQNHRASIYCDFLSAPDYAIEFHKIGNGEHNDPPYADQIRAYRHKNPIIGWGGFLYIDSDNGDRVNIYRDNRRGGRGSKDKGQGFPHKRQAQG